MSDPETVPVPWPSLAIDKPAPANADEDGSGDVSVGDTLSYTITATNDGTATLTGVVVSDDPTGEFTGDGSNPACADPLAPLATCVLTTDYVVTQADVDRAAARWPWWNPKDRRPVTITSSKL